MNILFDIRGQLLDKSLEFVHTSARFECFPNMSSLMFSNTSFRQKVEICRVTRVFQKGYATSNVISVPWQKFVYLINVFCLAWRILRAICVIYGRRWKVSPPILQVRLGSILIRPPCARCCVPGCVTKLSPFIAQQNLSIVGLGARTELQTAELLNSLT